MSRTLSRLLGRSLISQSHIKPYQLNNATKNLLGPKPLIALFNGGCSASYSKRSDSGDPFKVMTKSRDVDDELNDLDGRLNWDQSVQRDGRFFLPNAIGPAWQGDTSTVGLMEPLEHLVNFFMDDNEDKSRLEVSCCTCPSLLRGSIHELFPVRAISQKDCEITLVTLGYEGDIERGAAKFVLAAREICDRMLSEGFWADFLNPFSGLPYYLPRDGSKLYKQDSRFRGVNMRVSNHNECLMISSVENDKIYFSGTVFCSVPNDYGSVVQLLVPEEFKKRTKILLAADRAAEEAEEAEAEVEAEVEAAEAGADAGATAQTKSDAAAAMQ